MARWMARLSGLSGVSASDKGAIVASIQKAGLSSGAEAFVEQVENAETLVAYFKAFLPYEHGTDGDDDEELLHVIQAALKRRELPTVSDYEHIGRSLQERGEWEAHAGEREILMALGAVDVSHAMDFLLANAGDKTWLKLAKLEKLARNAEFGNKASKAKYTRLNDGELVLQLAMDRLCRILERGKHIGKGSVVDTSRSGVWFSSDRPSLIRKRAGVCGLSWELVSLVGELKKDFDDDSQYRDVIGRISSRLQSILDHQPGRETAYGFCTDGKGLEVVCRRRRQKPEFLRTQPFKISLEEDSLGLQLLLKLLLAEDSRLGCLPLPDFGCGGFIILSSGSKVESLSLLAKRKHSTVWKGQVQQGQKLTEEVVVKVGPNLLEEAQFMELACRIPGVAKLLDAGTLNDGCESYIVTPYYSGCLEFDDLPESLLEVVKQVAHTVNRLSRVGIFHGDISVANIRKDDKGQAVLVDFGSAVSASSPEKKSLTPHFCSYGVATGRSYVCLSSELECLLYVLVYMAVSGKLHWGRALTISESAAKKAECFAMQVNFIDHVLSRIASPLLTIAIAALRDLFWTPQYRLCVTFEEFIAVLDRVCVEFIAVK